MQHCCSFPSHFPKNLDFLKLSLPLLVPWMCPYSSHDMGGGRAWPGTPPIPHPVQHNWFLPTKSTLEVALQWSPVPSTPCQVSVGQAGLPLWLLGTLTTPQHPGCHCRSHGTGLVCGQGSCRWNTWDCRTPTGPSARLLPSVARCRAA